MSFSEKKKIFIIEDDANILFTLQAKFSIEGFKVEINNGTEDIERILTKIRLFKPDYLILDLMMPRIDGSSFLKTLKSETDINKSCILAFTHMSQADSNKWASLFGSDYYFIQDEFIPDSFVDKVIKIIDNREKMKNK